MITLNGKPVQILSADSDNMCSVRSGDEPVRVVSAFRLRATGGPVELGMAVRKAKDEARRLEAK